MRYDKRLDRLVPESKIARSIRRGTHGVVNKHGIVGQAIANMEQDKNLARFANKKKEKENEARTEVHS